MSALPAHGLIIGKFMPLTIGHCHLIGSALAQVQHLTVLVCSLRREPIPGHLRQRWLREAFPQAEVLHLTDELPSYPHEHADFWNLWREAVQRSAPGPVDVVFTSEDYGDRLAQELGARHVCVDMERRAVPISATQVRADPLRQWDFIAEAARHYFVKRVLIYGPESTGKTTLARDLAAHYQTEWVPEYARGYIETRGNTFEYSDFARFALGQLESEEAAARRANRLLFCDTDFITTTIYAQHYFGRCPPFIQRLADERRYDLVLFPDIDLPWQADPQRDLGQQREAMRDRFRDELQSRRIPFVTIGGLGEARLRAAVAAVDEFLRAAR
jgi:NadR type nicotinamide-nucleotide adenylyltransferase